MKIRIRARTWSPKSFAVTLIIVLFFLSFSSVEWLFAKAKCKFQHGVTRRRITLVNMEGDIFLLLEVLVKTPKLALLSGLLLSNSIRTNRAHETESCSAVYWMLMDIKASVCEKSWIKHNTMLGCDDTITYWCLYSILRILSIFRCILELFWHTKPITRLPLFCVNYNGMV